MKLTLSQKYINIYKRLILLSFSKSTQTKTIKIKYDLRKKRKLLTHNYLRQKKTVSIVPLQVAVV